MPPPEVKNGTQPAVHHDDEYKEAIQSVVDDNMRTDVLGPGVCKVLAEHTPAKEKLTALIAEAIEKEKSVKEAIESVLNNLDSKRKSKWVDRTIGAVGTIVLALIIGATSKYLLGN